MNTIKNLSILLVCAILFGCESEPTFVCSPVAIRNSSFEVGEPGLAQVPEGWTAWGTDLSSPDTYISGSTVNPWRVRAESQDGDRYIGLITRATGITEAIAQVLDKPIVEGVEGVAFDLWVSLTDSFIHNIPVEILRDYAKPVLLKVLVVDSEGVEHLLYISKPIADSEWQPLSATAPYFGDVSALVLKADYIGGEKYNGHVLVDNVGFGVCIME